MTAPTNTAATPEELAAPTTAEVISRLEAGDPTVCQAAADILRAQTRLLNHTMTKAAGDAFEAQRAEIERLTKELSATGYALVRACKRINDLDDKGDTHWNVRRLMLRCAIRYRTRATTAEAALSAVTAERDRMREALEATRRATTNTYAGCADNGGDSWSCSLCGEEWETSRDDPDPHHPECANRKVIAALSAKEATDER